MYLVDLPLNTGDNSLEIAQFSLTQVIVLLRHLEQRYKTGGQIIDFIFFQRASCRQEIGVSLMRGL